MLGLKSLLVKFQLDYNILLITDVRVKGINPSILVNCRMGHLGKVMVNNEVLEAVWDITSSDPYTTRSS